MCNPVLAVMAAAAVTSAASARQQSQANKIGYGMQADVASRNAEFASGRADDAIARGQTTEMNQRLKQASVAGTQRARFAARGLALDEGSPLAILQDTQYMGNVDAATIKDNAAREAWAYRAEADNFNANSALMRFRADSEHPNQAAFTSLLGGAGKVAGAWYGAKGGAG